MRTDTEFFIQTLDEMVAAQVDIDADQLPANAVSFVAFAMRAADLWKMFRHGGATRDALSEAYRGITVGDAIGGGGVKGEEDAGR